MKNSIPDFLLQKHSSVGNIHFSSNARHAYLDKGLAYISHVLKTGHEQIEFANKDGFFQRLSPQTKLLFLLFFIIIVSVKRDIISELIIAVFILGLIVISRLNIVGLYKRVLILGFIFGFLVALPSSLNIFNHGMIMFSIVNLSSPYKIWRIPIPENIGVTRDGILIIVMLTLRVINSLAISFLVLYTTAFEDIIKALKMFKVPDAILITITLSYKYIFIFVKTVEDMYLAKKSRMIAYQNAEIRDWIVNRFAFLFRKTQKKYEDVFKAMSSRGFLSDIKLYSTQGLNKIDWFSGIIFLFIGVIVVWI
jgi:cobalt ECF transporter T component CbiQ